jgi:hypothetical protein
MVTVFITKEHGMTRYWVECGVQMEAKRGKEFGGDSCRKRFARRIQGKASVDKGGDDGQGR